MFFTKILYFECTVGVHVPSLTCVLDAYLWCMRACVCVYVYGECVSVVCVCMLACVRVYVCECVRDRTEYQQQGKQIRSRWGGLGVEGID